MHGGNRTAADRVSTATWCFTGLLAALAATRVLAGVALEGARSAAPRPDELILTAIAWLGVALAAWLAFGCALALASLAPGALGRAAALLAERVTPTVLRKLLTLLLGASVGSLALPPALVSSAATSPPQSHAGWGRSWPGEARRGVLLVGPGYAPTNAESVGANAPSPSAADTPPPTPGRASASDTAPVPGFRPTPPLRAHDDAASTLLAPRPRPTVAALRLVTVRRGDTLWSIARRHLGPDASDAEIAREWPRWYAANRAVIGDDPDRILAGQQLVPPADRAGIPWAPTKE